MKKLRRSQAPALLLAFFAGGLHAQSSCSSDGQPQPVAVLERFISADCESCWSDARAIQLPSTGEIALDWIVPGSRGDDAPLSAAASREALGRLEALGRPIPPRVASSYRKVQSSAKRLRVAQGPPFGGYIGASIEFTPAGAGPWKAWLLLVETIPAGSEGTSVPRNVVRNSLQPAWDVAGPRSKEGQSRLFELRSMRIPEGTKSERLRVVGWVQDARGRIVAAGQSLCPTAR